MFSRVIAQKNLVEIFAWVPPQGFFFENSIFLLKLGNGWTNHYPQRTRPIYSWDEHMCKFARQSVHAFKSYRVNGRTAGHTDRFYSVLFEYTKSCFFWFINFPGVPIEPHDPFSLLWVSSGHFWVMSADSDCRSSVLKIWERVYCRQTHTFWV